MGIIFDPDSDPDTDLSACPHTQINPDNSNFHESVILDLIPSSISKYIAEGSFQKISGFLVSGLVEGKAVLFE